MVKAYRIYNDDTYQMIKMTDKSWEGGASLAVAQWPAEPIIRQWQRAEYDILDSDLERGDFFGVSSGNFACSRSVLERIRPCIEADCEILPITIRGLDDDDYVLIHPITVIEAMPPRDPNSSPKEMARQLIANMVAPPYEIVN
ncbi:MULTISPECIES: hypothetical protein [unclassified Microbulbifer]|uniref:hypothetical protein n=1 Tax=unclassified Microbulbifer TaxID=2619833 RepID=UPI0027E4C79A|nr:MULTISPECIES: hypothetical protein [unclassified Microbulbifer]